MFSWTSDTEAKLIELLNTETMKDVASALGCHVSTVEKAVKRLGIPYKKKTGSNARLTREWPNFSREQTEVIVGSLLGDGMITRRTPKFRIKQATKNCEYLEWLNTHLTPFMTGHIHNEQGVRKGKVFFSSTCYSRTDTRFRELREKWYPNGRKRVPHDVRLTPIICAHWHVQDGQNRQNKREVILNTNSFSIEDVEFLIERLRVDLGISSHWRKKEQSKPDAIIVMGNRLGDEGYFQFLELVRPYTKWKCFAYKADVREASKADFSRRNKLTLELAEEIRSLYSLGNISQYELAKQFGVCQAIVSATVNHKIHRS